MSQVEKSFRMTPSGAFMERRGAGWNEERRFCQKKLCFVATDQLLLAEVLGQLADRPDCCYVKYPSESETECTGEVLLAGSAGSGRTLGKVQDASSDDVLCSG